MAYELRERRHNGVLANYYCSEDEEESGEMENVSDPDYSRAGTSRRRGRDGARNPNQGRQRRKLLASSSSNQECSTSVRRPEISSDHKTVLSWLINRGEIRENERVRCAITCYVKEGKVRAQGVLCGCCNSMMDLSEFEIHAGGLSERPFDNIVVIRTRNSLLKHLLKLWNNGGCRQYNAIVPKPGAEDANDDACQFCADGGDLICCEECPSTFHLGCTEMQAIPAETWYCCYCRCKYCSQGCNVQKKLACVQCARAFHLQCYGTRENLDLNDDSLGLYCSSTCKGVAEKIQGMIGVKNLVRGGYSWSLIRRMEAVEIEDDHKRMEINSKVALACEVLNDSFIANTDRLTGINVLESVVNNRGSNLARMNFHGFYTLVLERDDAVISVATIRMHDNEIADMPYIATRKQYRNRGMSRLIFEALTYVLGCVGIKHLIIPALEEVAEMWLTKYGFVPLDDEMKKKLLNYNTLMFPGTYRLQKNLTGNSSPMEIDLNLAL